MKREDVIVAVHGANSSEGGAYNYLGTASQKLLQAFLNNGVQAYSTLECVEKKLPITFAIGFNVSGYKIWGELFKNNIINVMRNVDSIFYNNFEVVDQYRNESKFLLLTMTPCDSEPINKFFPNLNNYYCACSTDLNYSDKENCEKEFDIVYFGAMDNFENRLIELRSTTPPNIFSTMLTIYEIALKSPLLPFWHLVDIVAKQKGIEVTKELYHFLFSKLIYIIDYSRRAAMIKQLSKFNLKLFGGEEWKKHISGNIEYMGETGFRNSIKVMNRAKIVLHTQPLQLCRGLNERVLNASAIEAFTLASDIPTIKETFGDSVGYYNCSTFEDIADKVSYFLKNEDERNEMAMRARKIVEEGHTITHRTDSLLSALGIESLTLTH